MRTRRRGCGEEDAGRRAQRLRPTRWRLHACGGGRREGMAGVGWRAVVRCGARVADVRGKRERSESCGGARVVRGALHLREWKRKGARAEVWNGAVGADAIALVQRRGSGRWAGRSGGAPSAWCSASRGTGAAAAPVPAGGGGARSRRCTKEKFLVFMIRK